MSRQVQIIVLGLALLYAVSGQSTSCGGERTAEQCCCSGCPSATTQRPPIRIQIEGRENNQQNIYRPPPPLPPRPMPYYPVLDRDYQRYSPVHMPMPVPMPMPIPMPIAQSLPTGSRQINPVDNYDEGFYMVPVAATRRVIKKKEKE